MINDQKYVKTSLFGWFSIKKLSKFPIEKAKKIMINDQKGSSKSKMEIKNDQIALNYFSKSSIVLYFFDFEFSHTGSATARNPLNWLFTQIESITVFFESKRFYSGYVNY